MQIRLQSASAACGCGYSWSVCSSQGLTSLGLCRLSDLVGADIGLHTGMNFLEVFPERVYR